MGDSAAHRKLAGFLRAVVSLPSGNGVEAQSSIPPLSPCSLSACGAVPLAPIPDDGHQPRSKWWGCSGGSSVVRMLRMLVANRCVGVEGRVLRIATRRTGERDDAVVEARAVVLVDVYLPVAVWSGWQFPRSCTAAAAVFKHISCNWDARKALLAFDWTSHDNPHCDDRYIWSCTDCHVLGCEDHQIASISNNEKSFDLHEIFKSLPRLRMERSMQIARITPDAAAIELGIWSIPDDILNKVLIRLKPMDLIRVAATCHHLRTLLPLLCLA